MGRGPRRLEREPPEEPPGGSRSSVPRALAHLEPGITNGALGASCLVDHDRGRDESGPCIDHLVLAGANGISPGSGTRAAAHAVAPAAANVVRESGGCEQSLSAGAPVMSVGSCTVLEIGDSLGNDLGWGLARELPSGSSLKLVQLDKSSTGLANAGDYDSPTELPTDLGL
jgi:hypothetical protein